MRNGIFAVWVLTCAAACSLDLEDEITCSPNASAPVLESFTVLTDTIDVSLGDATLRVVAAIEGWVAESWRRDVVLEVLPPGSSTIERLYLNSTGDSTVYEYPITSRFEAGTWRLVRLEVWYAAEFCIGGGAATAVDPYVYSIAKWDLPDETFEVIN